MKNTWASYKNPTAIMLADPNGAAEDGLVYIMVRDERESTYRTLARAEDKGQGSYSLEDHDREHKKWKVHISVHPDDVEKAWNVIVDIIIDNQLPQAKVIKPEYLGVVSDQEATVAKPENRGKTITLYHGARDIDWLKALSEIEDTLVREEIRPGPGIISDRPIKGSRYMHYRSAEAEKIIDINDDEQFNPKSLPDPYAEIIIDGTRSYEEIVKKGTSEIVRS